MKAAKTAGLGVGAAVASAAASCHIVQALVLGLLGALGALPFAHRHPVLVVLAVFAGGALAVYSAVRLWRGRRPGYPSSAAPSASSSAP